jgi:hypothetical protein
MRLVRVALVGRLGGFLLLSAGFAIVYVLWKGPSHEFTLGGHQGYLMPGWKVLIGALVVLLGVAALGAIVAGKKRLQGGLVAGACTAAVIAIVFTSTALGGATAADTVFCTQLHAAARAGNSVTPSQVQGVVTDARQASDGQLQSDGTAMTAAIGNGDGSALVTALNAASRRCVRLGDG